jgi:4-aminobutyrate aminotransferase
LAEGRGNKLIDADGNEYLDCFSAASTNLLGYSTGLEEVYRRQAAKIQHTAFGYSPNVNALELAVKLIDISPGSSPKKVIFGLTGSDACDSAVAAARKYTGKTGTISFEYSYHGSTGFSQPASGFDRHSDGIYDADSREFVKLDYPTTDIGRDRVLSEIDELLTGEYGSVLIEPIQGDAGVRQPAAGFFSRLRKTVSSHDAVLVVDEIQTGMGRSGRWWAIEYEEVEPDIYLVAKGLAAGYAPISVAVGKREFIDALEPGQRIFSFVGHPPSAAVAAKTIEIIDNRGLIERAAQLGRNIKKRLEEIKASFGEVVRDVRGRGFLMGLEVNYGGADGAAVLFARRAVEKGLYVGFFGIRNDVVRVQPPLTLKDEEADRAVNVIGDIASEMARGRIPAETRECAEQYSVGM